jgi:hypothetical protein
MTNHAKTGSTLYPAERVANARRNIERYGWAREIRDAAVASADKFAALSDDFLWELVTPQDIPRGTQVNMNHGCPKCGLAIEKFGGQPWKVDPIERPWKIECPSCGGVFPTNDFAAFYESGKNSAGVFHYDAADRSLLFNADHPDPDDPLHSYGVDDTMGFDDGSTVYRFIGYYGHHGSWGSTLAALTSFRDAYVYTGDPTYARKAGLMLYRAAQFYPDMDWAPWKTLGFNNSDGGSGLGKVYGRIWETIVADTIMSAYDAVYPSLDDPELRELFESNVIHVVHDAILSRCIEGNEGMYQHTMAVAAVVLDEPGVTDQWLDWIFAPGDMRAGDTNGGNMLDIFDKKVDEDGMGDESSPSYNGIWRNQFRHVSDILEVYPRYTRHSITGIPKYKKMWEAPVRLICLDTYIPNIGDCGKTGYPHRGGITADDMVYAYRTFEDPKFARMAVFLNSGSAEGLRGGIFDAEPEEIGAEISKHGPYVQKTDNMPGYGLAILRSGSGVNARALTLYYGRNIGHGHKDTLNIELFGHGVDLMPDLGYPEHATVWPSRYEWSSNTISHNTVVVDGVKQSESLRGTANFVVEGDGVSVAEVFADKPYPQTSLYQRTIAMIDISDRDFYIVDIFRVRGGTTHLNSLHGPEGEIELEGLSLIVQPGGTLAGEDVELGADIGLSDNYWARATGFQYLYDIRRDPYAVDQPAVTWNVADTWGVIKEPRDLRLRVNLVSPKGEVILAHGDPPRNKVGNPRRLTYLLTRRDATESTFVSVIEPYSGARTISSIERNDDGDTVVITVKLASGRIDTIISALEPIEKKIGGVDFRGRFGVICEEQGQTAAHLVVH